MKTHKLLITLFLCFSFLILKAQDITNSKVQEKAVHPTLIRTGTFLGETPPLRTFPALTAEELKKMAKKHERKEEENEKNGGLAHRSYPFAETALPKGPDAAWQKSLPVKSAKSASTLQNFAGQTSPYYPPDCNGAAGPGHYMQTVNSTYAIYNKSGTLLAGPTNMNTLFTGVTGATYNDGDPIVLYDEQAQRFFAAEFSISGSNDYMLVAVSATSDPTGTWYKYSFDVADMPDYPKFGVWQDGYYMADNNGSGNDIYVFQRSVMLSGGASPQMIAFDNPNRPTSIDGFMCVPPVDNDGTFAPTGAPGTFIAFNDDAIAGGSDQLWIYELTANWVTPASSTFSRVQQLSVTAFDSNFGTGWNNIAQSGTSMKVDAIPQVMMNVPQYRNFGSYQTIVCCHNVDVDNTDHAGVRWYELRRGTQTSGNWTIRQQGTYAPDANSRWMGSIVLNGSGKIGLGYSVSSSSMFPAIRYTGQSSAAYNAGAGQMDITETSVQEGSYSQTAYNRWGDYAAMSVDPTDDQTFWFTSEYIGSGGARLTKIASFKLGNNPVATTVAATNILQTSVTLNGTVNPNGLATTYYFEYGLTTSYGSTTTTLSAGSGTAAVAESANLTGLTAGQIYHFRIVATNSDGGSNGSDLTFTTLGAATVTTTAASTITGSTAVSGGNVTSDGGSTVTVRGVCWGTSANPTKLAGNYTTDGSGTGVFTSSITGLLALTGYHVRAYATNVNGTYYGNDITFTTLCGNITSFPWNEGFENSGSIPNCWTQEQVNSSGINWTFVTGNGASNPAAAHGGTYNACIKDANTTSNKTKLITPSLYLSSVNAPRLRFWHAQQVRSGRQDTLIIFYKTSAAGTWTQLAKYSSSLSSWTKDSINLPNSSSDYYIAFEGNAKWGYGVCVDDVSIISASSNTITTGTITGSPFCAGASVSVPYTITGTYTAGNIFTSQLSDATGSFTAPVTIGTLTSINAGSVSAAIPTSTVSGSAYRIRVISSTPSITGTANTVNLTVNSTIAPTGTASQNFCNSATVANLQATGTGILWYAASSGGTALSTSTALVSGNHYYASQTLNGCESISRFDVTVTIGPVSAPTGTASQTFCNSATVANLQATGTAILWYAASSGGTALSTATALVNGNHYYASQTLNGCESTGRFDVTVTINVPSAPTGTASQTFCNSATVANLQATGTGILWYAASSGGTALSSATSLSNGNHYYASQTINSCESNGRFDVTVTINVPSAPTGTASQTFCNAATVANLQATGTGILWYAASSGGTALSTVTALVNGNHYYASQTINTCESAGRFDVTVTINIPSAPTGTASQTFCNAATVANLQATGTAILWYAASSGGTALSTAISLVSGNHYYASQTVSGCESVGRFDVTVTVYNSSTLTAPSVGSITQPTCTVATASVILNDLPPTGSWTLTRYPGGTTLVGSGISTTITGLFTGTYYYTVTNSVGCTSVASADIVINQQPHVPTTPGTISGATVVCQGQDSVIYTVPLVGLATSYVWTMPSGASGTSSTNSIVVNYGISAVTGNITVNGNNICGDGPVKSLAITVNHLPTDAGVISGDFDVCQGQTSVNYSVPTIAYATSYVWTLPTGATGTSTTKNITIDYGISAVSGDMSVKGHNTCGDGVGRTQAITVNPLPSDAGIISGAVSVCMGQNPAHYSIPDIPNATSYVWTLPIGATGNSITNSIDVNYGAGAVSGNIIVKGNNACGDGNSSTLGVMVNSGFSFTEYSSICNGDTLNWQGANYATAGTYTANHTSINGCDSNYTLNLTIKPAYNFAETHIICEGDIYLWRGQNLTTAGIYYDTYKTNESCDSIYTLTLRVNPAYHITEYYSVCAGDSYIWHGQTLTTAGTYMANYQTIIGCDSNYTLHFNINPAQRTLEVKVFLEGLYSGGGLMNQAHGISGPEFGVDIADQVTVELHDAFSPYNTSYQESNLSLLTNGMLTISALPCNISGLQYLVIKHRNSIETWSNSPLDFNAPSPITYDFTTAASQAYGNNQTITGIVYSLWGGDNNQDGVIDGSDMAAVDNASTPPPLKGYNSEDINGDGVVDGSDMVIIDNNSTPPPIQVKRP